MPESLILFDDARYRVLKISESSLYPDSKFLLITTPYTTITLMAFLKIITLTALLHGEELIDSKTTL